MLLSNKYCLFFYLNVLVSSISTTTPISKRLVKNVVIYFLFFMWQYLLHPRVLCKTRGHCEVWQSPNVRGSRAPKLSGLAMTGSNEMVCKGISYWKAIDFPSSFICRHNMANINTLVKWAAC